MPEKASPTLPGSGAQIQSRSFSVTGLLFTVKRYKIADG